MGTFRLEPARLPGAPPKPMPQWKPKSWKMTSSNPKSYCRLPESCMTLSIKKQRFLVVYYIELSVEDHIYSGLRCLGCCRTHRCRQVAMTEVLGSSVTLRTLHIALRFFVAKYEVTTQVTRLAIPISKAYTGSMSCWLARNIGSLYGITAL